MIDINDFTNKVLTCVDCGNKFTFEAGEQAFYFSKGLAAPKRCKACRDKRRNTLIKGVRYAR